MTSIEHHNNSARLAWRCRRGMLELDLLLQNFLDTGYQGLSAAQQVDFETLLDYPDQTLLEYLLGRIVPVEPALADVVEKIRSAARP